MAYVVYTSDLIAVAVLAGAKSFNAIVMLAGNTVSFPAYAIVTIVFEEALTTTIPFSSVVAWISLFPIVHVKLAFLIGAPDSSTSIAETTPSPETRIFINSLACLTGTAKLEEAIAASCVSSPE